MLEYKLTRGPLWGKLSRTSRCVYEQIKSSRNIRGSNGKTINTTDDNIEFGLSDYNGEIAKNTFYDALKELRSSGLIDIISYGEFPRKKAIYSLSKRWIVYNYNLQKEQEEKK